MCRHPLNGYGARELAAWIVQPGRLTDDEGTGRARIDVEPFRNEVTRDDVARALAAVLHEPRSTGLVLYVGAGDQLIEEALASAIS